MNGDAAFHALHHARADETAISQLVDRMRVDRRLREELAVAKTYGLPYSRLLDTWDPDDIDMAIAFERYQAGICRECGIHRDDWPTDEHDPPFEVHASRCHGCATLAAFWHEQKDRSERETAGVKAALARVTPEWLTDPEAWAAALNPDLIGW